MADLTLSVNDSVAIVESVGLVQDPRQWPISLQQRQYTGVTEQRQDASLRTKMESGASKKRKRFTAAIRSITVPFVFTQSDKVTFDSFYISTLKEGSLTFEWVDPVDDSTTVTYRFVKPPLMTKKGGEWKGVLALEVLP